MTDTRGARTITTIGSTNGTSPRLFIDETQDLDHSRFQDSRTSGISAYVFISSAIACMSSFCIGWAIGVLYLSKSKIHKQQNLTTNPALGKGSIWNGEFPQSIYFDDTMWLVAVGMLSIGGLLGGLISGSIAESIGPRNTIVVNNSLLIAGSVLLGTATTSIHFILGRFVTGLGCGVASCVVLLYISEISPARHRGFYGCFFQLSTAFGITLSQASIIAFDSPFAWRIIIAIPAAVAFLQSIILPFRVESPSYLLRSYQVNEARHSLLTLRRGYDVSCEWQDYLNGMMLEEDRANCSKVIDDEGTPAPIPNPGIFNLASHPNLTDCCSSRTLNRATLYSFIFGGFNEKSRAWRRLLNHQENMQKKQYHKEKNSIGLLSMLFGRTRDDLRHLSICSIMLTLGQQMCNMNGVMNYTNSIFLSYYFGRQCNTPQLPHHKGHTMSMCAKWASIGVSACGLPAIIMCMIWVDKLGRKTLLLTSQIGTFLVCAMIFIGIYFDKGIIAVTMVFVYHFLYSVGFGTIPWFYTYEVIPSYGSAAIASVSCSIGWTGSFIISIVLHYIHNHLVHFTFLLFGCVCFVLLLFTWVFVPETAHKTVNDIVEKHRGGLHIASEKASARAGDA